MLELEKNPLGKNPFFARSAAAMFASEEEDMAVGDEGREGLNPGMTAKRQEI